MFSTNGFSSITFIDIFAFTTIWSGTRELEAFITRAFKTIFFVRANMITIMTANFALTKVFDNFGFQPIGNENLHSQSEKWNSKTFLVDKSGFAFESISSKILLAFTGK